MSKKTYEFAYICNGRNPACGCKVGCYYRPTNGFKGACMHTTDKKYAKNGARNPKKNRDLFDKFVVGDIVRYYEKY